MGDGSSKTNTNSTTAGTGNDVNAGDTSSLDRRIHAAREMSDDEFFESRPWLKAISDISRGQTESSGRWGVYFELLASLAAKLPPNVYVEPLNGTERGSLNLYVAVTGEPGSGKGKTWRLAKQLIPRDGVAVGQVASGEAIASLFVTRTAAEPGKKSSPTLLECRKACALLHFSEAEFLSGTAARQGSTIVPVLNSGFSGEEIGASNKKQDNTLIVPENGYRLCMIIEVQPGAADALLNHESTGLPSRFLWTDTKDPQLPAHKKLMPPYPLVDSKQLPSNGADLCEQCTNYYRAVEQGEPFPRLMARGYQINLPDSIMSMLSMQSDAKVRGEVSTPSLDAHRSELVIRVAALTAIMDYLTKGGDMNKMERNITVSEEEYALAERAVKHSDDVRSRFVQAANREHVLLQKQRIQDSERARDASIRDTLMKRLRAKAPCDGHTLLNGRTGQKRDDYMRILGDMIEEGTVLESVIGVNGRSLFYLPSQKQEAEKLMPFRNPKYKVDGLPLPKPVEDGGRIDLNSMGFASNYIPFSPAQNLTMGKGEKACLTQINGLSWKDAAQQNLPETRTVPQDSPAYAVVPGVHEIVLDCDVDKKNPQGMNGFTWIESRLGEYGSDNFPRTMVVRTPSGGYHLYYKIPVKYQNMKFTNVVHKKGSNVDVRACQSGYVLGVGSRTSRGEYELCDKPDDNRIPEMPETMVKLVKYLETPDEPTRPTTASAPRYYRSDSWDDGRLNMNMTIIPEGERNSTLYDQAFGLLKNHPDKKQEIREKIFVRGRASGLSEKEIWNTWNSVCRELGEAA
jgi:hypothetical protein